MKDMMKDGKQMQHTKPMSSAQGNSHKDMNPKRDDCNKKMMDSMMSKMQKSGMGKNGM